MMEFKEITADAKSEIQAVTFRSGLRNCNFTFANLVGWQPEFGTCYCIYEDALVLRYCFDGQNAYLVNSAQTPSVELVDALWEDAASRGEDLLLMGLEDDWAQELHSRFPGISTITPRRNRYDYLYLREELVRLAGKHLKSKRNHCNRFVEEHPDYEYRPLTPDLFGDCLALVEHWSEVSEHENPSYGDSLSAEKRVLLRFFANWQKLDMLGGAIFANGRMVAFTLGAPVTTDTFDICVEKADRNINGAFNIINQQFAEHLTSQYRYINREEDMGLEGLRKAKLSYHPHQLLSFNVVTIKTTRLVRCTPADSEETIDWITRQYGFERDEVASWVSTLHFNWPMSVKAVDMEGRTVGLLNMSDYRVEEETERIMQERPDLVEALGKLKSIAVFSFIVAEEYRHTRLNYQMLMNLWPDLQSYDFIFVPVMHRLQTHRYWQRWGAREFFRDEQSVYYLIPLSSSAKGLTL
ncbi:MAG: DUF2156 domain-containing protein [Bacteroidales bacterium]|nr:DUF2156 domain-containing protein [Bacteroidales bacterium]